VPLAISRMNLRRTDAAVGSAGKLKRVILERVVYVFILG